MMVMIVLRKYWFGRNLQQLNDRPIKFCCFCCWCVIWIVLMSSYQAIQVNNINNHLNLSMSNIVDTSNSSRLPVALFVAGMDLSVQDLQCPMIWWQHWSSKRVQHQSDTQFYPISAHLKWSVSMIIQIMALRIKIMQMMFRSHFMRDDRTVVKQRWMSTMYCKLLLLVESFLSTRIHTRTLNDLWIINLNFYHCNNTGPGSLEADHLSLHWYC